MCIVFVFSALAALRLGMFKCVRMHSGQWGWPCGAAFKIGIKKFHLNMEHPLEVLFSTCALRDIVEVMRWCPLLN